MSSMQESGSISKPRGKERIIFALDVPSPEEARQLIKELDGLVSFYKVGWELFIQTGLTFVREMRACGHRVFLDVKMTPDIPEQLRRTVRRLVTESVDFITIHGNGKTVRIVRNAVADLPVRILSITALTSMTLEDVRDLYLGDPRGGEVSTFKTVEDFVRARAGESLENGAHGLIASGLHAKWLRQEFGRDFLLVCPGIRPEGSAQDDHQRIATPRQAVIDGADYLVIGRPIRDADDRRAMTRRIIMDIEEAESA